MVEIRVSSVACLTLGALAALWAWLAPQELEERAPAVGFRLNPVSEGDLD